MSGHGWVFPRPDGRRASCGGPAICGPCSVELTSRQNGATAPLAAVPVPVEDGIDHTPGCSREHRKGQVCRFPDTWDDGDLQLTPRDLEALGKIGADPTRATDD